MNQTFSLPRFGRLLRKYFTDNRGQLLVNVALLVVGMTLFGLVVVYRGLPASLMDMQVIMFFGIGWLAWFVFTIQQVHPVNQNDRALTYLLQPASQLEKITLIWLISGLGFVIVFGLCFGLIDYLGVEYINSKTWSADELKLISQFGVQLPVSTFYNNPSRELIFWVLTAMLHPFVLAFSLLIRRHTLPIVAIIALIILPVSVLLNGYLLHTAFGFQGIRPNVPFSGVLARLNAAVTLRMVNLPQPIGDHIRYLVGFTAFVLLYVTAYFRLKEREV